MDNKIFRQSSIDRVNSPEQLNDYIRVANPSVWMVLAAIVLLLLGMVIWGVFGRVETTVDTGIITGGGNTLCFVDEDTVARLNPGMAVTAQGVSGTIASVGSAPVQVDDSFPDYLRYLTGFEQGDFCYPVQVELSGLEPGVYEAVITLDSVHPISFVTH